MNNCLNCGAELKQIEGSREKKYCNDICRASYHQKKNRGKEPQYVKYSTFKELKDKFDKLAASREVKIADLNKSTNQVKDITKDPPKTNYTISIKNKEVMPDGLTWKEQLEWNRNH